ncbi:MAG: helix-turn-helix transcriptional regulator [Gemmatimonadaceae bacterium]
MDVIQPRNAAVASIAAAIGEPTRARMLYCLMDGRARTSTELAMVGDVSPSTASAHLNRLKAERLVRLLVQGKHRYYSLGGADVASALEALGVLAGGVDPYVPTTTHRLRAARTCYDHIAGVLGVGIHDRVLALGWLRAEATAGDDAYALTPRGEKAMIDLGIDLATARRSRRRFAFGCLDWSERRAHIGGAIGAALLDLARARRWVAQDRELRALTVTTAGKRELRGRFGLLL